MSQPPTGQSQPYVAGKAAFNLRQHIMCCNSNMYNENEPQVTPRSRKKVTWVVEEMETQSTNQDEDIEIE